MVLKPGLTTFFLSSPPPSSSSLHLPSLHPSLHRECLHLLPSRNTWKFSPSVQPLAPPSLKLSTLAKTSASPRTFGWLSTAEGYRSTSAQLSPPSRPTPMRGKFLRRGYQCMSGQFASGLGTSVQVAWAPVCKWPGHQCASGLGTSVQVAWVPVCKWPGHQCTSGLSTSVQVAWAPVCKWPGHQCTSGLGTSVQVAWAPVYKWPGHQCASGLGTSVQVAWAPVCKWPGHQCASGLHAKHM